MIFLVLDLTALKSACHHAFQSPSLKTTDHSNSFATSLRDIVKQMLLCILVRLSSGHFTHGEVKLSYSLREAKSCVPPCSI